MFCLAVVDSASADKCVAALSDHDGGAIAHCADVPKASTPNVKVYHVVIGGDVFDTEAQFFASAYAEVSFCTHPYNLQVSMVAMFK